MVKQNAKYGFTIAIHEFRETVTTLWKTTMEFMREWKKMHPTFNPELLRFFGNENEYNMCHYWSNFEIGSLKWLNSDEYLSYFNYLDQAGGYFYERWGDAPVHSIAVGMFLKKEEVIFFDKIGYFHNPMSHCPVEPFHKQLNCECKIEEAITENGYSCVPQWRRYTNTKWYN